jgi:hypothetical protein
MSVSNSGSKLMQAISYAINQYSTLPFISRMHLYEVMHQYIISQETRISNLENDILYMQTKLSCEKQKQKQNQKPIKTSI